MKEEIEKKKEERNEKEQNAPILEVGKTIVQNEKGDTTQEQEIQNSPEVDSTTKEKLLKALEKVKKLEKKTSQNGLSREEEESKQEKREKWRESSNYQSNDPKRENKQEMIEHKIEHKKEENISEI